MSATPDVEKKIVVQTSLDTVCNHEKLLCIDNIVEQVVISMQKTYYMQLKMLLFQLRKKVSGVVQHFAKFNVEKLIWWS